MGLGGGGVEMAGEGVGVGAMTVGDFAGGFGVVVIVWTPLMVDRWSEKSGEEIGDIQRRSPTRSRLCWVSDDDEHGGGVAGISMARTRGEGEATNERGELNRNRGIWFYLGFDSAGLVVV
ncbi:hypothetical protein Droror1_Dr00017304 [Drosera rotundifolia]